MSGGQSEQSDYPRVGRTINRSVREQFYRVRGEMIVLIQRTDQGCSSTDSRRYELRHHSPRNSKRTLSRSVILQCFVY